jgi:hypothetical protein
VKNLLLLAEPKQRDISARDSVRDGTFSARDSVRDGTISVQGSVRNGNFGTMTVLEMRTLMHRLM